MKFHEKSVLTVTILLRKVARCILGTRNWVLTLLRRQRKKMFQTSCGRLVFLFFTAVFMYLNHIYRRGTALLCPYRVVYLPENSCKCLKGRFLRSNFDPIFHAYAPIKKASTRETNRQWASGIGFTGLR